MSKDIWSSPKITVETISTKPIKSNTLNFSKKIDVEKNLNAKKNLEVAREKIQKKKFDEANDIIHKIMWDRYSLEYSVVEEAEKLFEEIGKHKIKMIKYKLIYFFMYTIIWRFATIMTVPILDTNMTRIIAVLSFILNIVILIINEIPPINDKVIKIRDLIYLIMLHIVYYLIWRISIQCLSGLVPKIIFRIIVVILWLKYYFSIFLLYGVLESDRKEALKLVFIGDFIITVGILFFSEIVHFLVML